MRNSPTTSPTTLHYGSASPPCTPITGTKEESTLSSCDSSPLQKQPQRNFFIDRLLKTFFYGSIIINALAIIASLALGLTHTWEAAHVFYLVAGVFCICSSAVSILLIYCHLTSYTNPLQQRHIIRLLLMVPIYAVDSFIGIAFLKYGTMIGVIRDTYDGYLLFQFFRLMLNLAGGEESLVSMWKQQHVLDKKEAAEAIAKENAKKGENTAIESGAGETVQISFVGDDEDDVPVRKHLPPLTCCCKPFRLDRRTIKIWNACTVLFLVLNVILTIITIPTFLTDHYHDGGFFQFNDSYFYLSQVRMMVIGLPLTALAHFYLSSRKFLQEHGLGHKFIVIKIVIFLSVWQKMNLTALNHFGVMPKSSIWTPDQVATGLQNFMVCIEMYGVALAQCHVFSHQPYTATNVNSFSQEVLYSSENNIHPTTTTNNHKTSNQQEGESSVSLTWAAVRHAFSLSDVWQDVVEGLKMLAPWEPRYEPNTPRQQQQGTDAPLLN